MKGSRHSCKDSKTFVRAATRVLQEVNWLEEAEEKKFRKQIIQCGKAQEGSACLIHVFKLAAGQPGQRTI